MANVYRVFIGFDMRENDFKNFCRPAWTDEEYIYLHIYTRNAESDGKGCFQQEKQDHVQGKYTKNNTFLRTKYKLFYLEKYKNYLFI